MIFIFTQINSYTSKKQQKNDQTMLFTNFIAFFINKYFCKKKMLFFRKNIRIFSRFLVIILIMGPVQRLSYQQHRISNVRFSPSEWPAADPRGPRLGRGGHQVPGLEGPQRHGHRGHQRGRPQAGRRTQGQRLQERTEGKVYETKNNYLFN